MIIHKNKFLILWILALICLVPLIIFKYYQYIVFDAIVFIFAFIFWIIAIIDSKDENKVYDSYLKEILKTFDSILINVTEVPDISGKNVININSIEDLVDAQIEIRKPIYYYLDINSCTFMIIEDNQLCLYVLRKNDSVVAVIDGIIKEEINKKQIKMENERKAMEKDNNDSSILDDIDKTTIIKFGSRSFRVSPIRDIELPKRRR